MDGEGKPAFRRRHRWEASPSIGRQNSKASSVTCDWDQAGPARANANIARNQIRILKSPCICSWNYQSAPRATLSTFHEITSLKRASSRKVCPMLNYFGIRHGMTANMFVRTFSTAHVEPRLRAPPPRVRKLETYCHRVWVSSVRLLQSHTDYS